MARAGDILHQEDAIVMKHRKDAPKDFVGMGLVVDDIESGHQVIAWHSVEPVCRRGNPGADGAGVSKKRLTLGEGRLYWKILSTKILWGCSSGVEHLTFNQVVEGSNPSTLI